MKYFFCIDYRNNVQCKCFNSCVKYTFTKFIQEPNISSSNTNTNFYCCYVNNISNSKSNYICNNAE